MQHHVFSSDLGECAVAWRQRGLCRLWLPEPTPSALRRRIKETGSVSATKLPRWCRDAIARIQRHCEDGHGGLQRIPIDLAGQTPFRSRVYHALREVRRGSTITYSQLAARAGHPGAQRAIGGCMANNPLPLVVPCHRVLAQNGTGGFSAHGGVETKSRLLSLEGICLDPQPLFTFDVADGLRSLRKASPAMHQLIARVGAFRMQPSSTASTEESLARAIVFQQLTAMAASSIYRRLIAQLGGELNMEAVVRRSDAALRQAGLSQNKTLALKELAQKSLAGEVPTLQELGDRDDERIIEQLSRLRGIGRWSVEMLLMFRLRRKDVMPLGDYGILKGFGRSHGISKPTRSQLREASCAWRPYRSMACWYLWRANDLL